ncbi:conserved Plasmodium protein, unknown function [Plasmodium vinckei vinckei]|uniref:MORN repeat protein n=1 Tax=Plasmodium vinckei vinckei TaxID=54757 RepID=A0A449BUB3_PLAVN|nr:conserved Plasmodium protein, unknown function [Plasmodium vinckei vinckei]KEG03204.1 hypothetical protein YYE_02138 [Plasmodium vinckei vinckei]VEV57011.1 conserved Plasmodium protein, unknown function [Plasmodium vinckei vinckei]
MMGDSIKKDCAGFIINEEDEFSNIFNYKNVKCFKFPNYIYIGQIKESNETEGTEDKKNETSGNKKKAKEELGNKEKIEKTKKNVKKKKVENIIKEGYGMLLSLKKNSFGEEIIVNKFIGNWKNDKKSGLGLNIYLNKNIYYGYYINDMKNGYGNFIWNDSKSTYEGNWTNNYMQGNGKYKNKNYIFDGNFHMNKFVNFNGEWIDIIEIEKNYSKNNRVNKEIILNNNIDLIILSFDFLKVNLKKIATTIKYKYNKIPFIIRSKNFVDKHKQNIDLSKLIFLSYYLNTLEVENYLNDAQLTFDSLGKGILKDQNINFDQDHNNYNVSNFDETESESIIKSEISCSHTSDQCSESNDSNSTGKNSSNDRSSELEDSITFSNSDDSTASYGSRMSIFSNIPEIYSKENSLNSIKDDNENISNPNECTLNNLIENKTGSIESDGSELKEYIKNRNLSKIEMDKKAKDTFSKSGSIRESNINNNENDNNLNESNYDSKNRESYDLKMNNDTTYVNIEEKRKNEINKLISKYVNIYNNCESDSSEYSILSSGKETTKSCKNDTNNENTTEQIKSEENENKNEKDKEETPNEIININNKGNNYDNMNKIVKNDILKIYISIKFLKKLRKCNLSCTYNINKKIKNSLILNYPFIFNLNYGKNKNEITLDHLFIKNVTIPKFWNLSNYFGDSVDKIPKDIFTPLYFDFNNENKNIFNFSQINKNDKTNLENDCGETPFNLNFFMVTDLLVDETNDINYLKSLLIDKFKDYLYVNNLFFIIIE